MKLKKVMDLDNVVGKSKTLTKFDAWFFFMKLENQEESFNVVAFWGFFLHCIALHCIYYILYIIFYVFLLFFFILHKQTTLIFKDDR